MNEIINCINEIQRLGRKDLVFGVGLGIGSILLGVLSAKRLFEAGIAAGSVEVLNENVKNIYELEDWSKKKKKISYKEYYRKESE